MPTTRILTSLGKDTDKGILKKSTKDYEIIQVKLKQMGRNFTEDIPFEQFLKSLQMTETEYELAIRTSLKRNAVFLKRSTNAIFINPYNMKILKTWRANMDIQFVLDQFACAQYVVSYIGKSSRGVSKLLRKANEEVKKGNLGLKQRLRSLGNVFNNFVQISAQEAAVMVLGIDLVFSSRSEIYINTSPPHERTFLLKTDKEIAELDDDSEEIAAASIIYKYTHRLAKFENICLADFASLYNHNKGTESKDFSSTERRRPKIIRYRRYGMRVDPANYYREQAMLFIPWRDEISQRGRSSGRDRGLLDNRGLPAGTTR
jgi:hypothetical protein